LTSQIEKRRKERSHVSHYHSIYANDRSRPRRWPWVLLLLLIALSAGVAGAAITSGESANELLQSAHLKAKSAAPMPTAPAQALVADPTQTATAATAATAANPTVAAAVPAAATTAPPVAAAPASPTVAESNPADVAQAYAAAWSKLDYDSLYGLLTASAQKSITRADFVARYQAIATESGITRVKATVTGQPDLDTKAPIKVEMTSTKVGAIAEDNAIQLRNDGGLWKVDWTPSLIFTGLGANCVDFTADPITRGSILDRNGVKLAYDGAVSMVGIIPGELDNAAVTVKALSKLIGVSTDDITAKYKNGQPDWFMPIKQYSGQMDQTLLNGIGQLKGVAVHNQVARIYPLGPQAAHITGYVTLVNADDLAADKTGSLADGEWIGRAGLEAGANDVLSGVPGGKLAIVDCTSRTENKVIAQRKSVAPQDLVLTIDANFQKTVYATLGDVKGSAVILDPRNGAVLALASVPSFDPNWFVTGLTAAQLAQVNDNVNRPLLDRAAQTGYPTGSIFKIITMAAGMKDLNYTGDTMFSCPVEWSLPGSDQVWRDWTAEEGLGAQGDMSLHWALVNSCDTIFYQVGAALDQKADNLLPDMAKAFGLGRATGIPYLDEIAGIVPDPKWKQANVNDYWARGDAVNLSIGQGYLEATPLQMAIAYTAIANQGSVLQPFLVEFTKSSDGSLTRVGKKVVTSKLPLSKNILTEIQSALRDQTSNAAGAGSFRVFGDMTWPIAGKTGTAENALDVSKKPHSWFAAFGPYGDTATITSIVMIESSGEGVSFAAPRTRQIYDAYLKTALATQTQK